MNKKRILSSVITIALCLCLVAGSTFALFTSNDEVNIAVTAGTVKVSAYLSDFQTFSMDKATAVNGVFDNGGTAVYNNDGTLTLNDITPGDLVKFNVNIENQSNVDVQYRLRMFDEGTLAEVLEAHVHIPGTVVDVKLTPDEQDSVWMDLPETGIKFPVEVELPELVKNDYQNNDAKITVIVEAVQANEHRGNVEVSSADQLIEALSQKVDYPLNIKLTSDIEFDKNTVMTASNGETKGKIVVEDLEVTLDLNGKTLSLAGKNQAIRAIGTAELTITGDGTVSVTDSGKTFRMIYAQDSAKVTVLNGTFKNSLRRSDSDDFVYTGITTEEGSDALVEIYGGTFDIPSAARADGRGYPCLLDNINEKNAAVYTPGINVYGGTFVNQNPSKGYLGQDPASTALVPDGYETVVLGADSNGNQWFKVQEAVPTIDPVAMTANTAAMTYTVTEAGNLVWMAEQVKAGNNFDGYTVVLANSLDLGGATIPTIGEEDKPFHGDFDGATYEISNFKIDVDSYGGLFGNVVGTIKDLKVSGANVQSTHYAGGIVAYIHGSVLNCKVSNSVIAATDPDATATNGDGDKVGGIVGFIGNGNCNISGCTVEKTNISANRDAGQVAGSAYDPAHVNNCTVDNVEVVWNGYPTGANIYPVQQVGRII